MTIEFNKETFTKRWTEMLEAQKRLDERIIQGNGLTYADLYNSDRYQHALLDELGELNHELKSRWCWWKKTQKPENRDKVLEDKGPWKPETGDRYFHIYGNGDFEEDCWFGGAADDYRAEIGNVFRTNAEIKRIVHRLKARKKFLDAGGHEGMDGYEFEDKYHAYPQRCDKTLIVAKEDGVTAFDIWFETEDACQKAIDSLTDDEKAALCWMGESE